MISPTLQNYFDELRNRLESDGWQKFKTTVIDDLTLVVSVWDCRHGVTDSHVAMMKLLEHGEYCLGKHGVGWKIVRCLNDVFEYEIQPHLLKLPDIDEDAPEATQDADETAETMNELRRKFAGVKWDLLALGAYIAHNIEIDELRDVITSNDQQTTADHLRNIIAAEFGVDQAQVSDMNAELINSIGAGGVNVVRWSRDQYLNWMKGVHLATIDYSLLLRLLFDIENEETDTQTRIHDKPE